jgi:hypothetical protein
MDKDATESVLQTEAERQEYAITENLVIEQISDDQLAIHGYTYPVHLLF